MKRLAVFLLIPTIFLLTGCLKQNIKPSDPKPINTSGIFIHKYSGITFPEKIGGYDRVSIIQYDEDQYHIGVGYNYLNNSNSVTATIYIYPIPLTSFGSPESVIDVARRTLFENHYAEVKSELLSYYPTSKQIQESDYSEPGYNKRVLALNYKCDFAGMKQDLESFMALFTRDNWYIKFRITSPSSNNMKDEIFYDMFLKTLE